MKRKLCRTATALILTLSLLLPGSLAAAAGTTTTVSDAGLALIKDYEGFSSTAYLDGSGWRIGYGTTCGQYDYPGGISTDTADALLRESVASHCQELIEYLNRVGFAATQTQFDALADFTFNLGGNWMSYDCQLTRLLSGGSFDAADVVNAFGVWCHSGGSINSYLVERRVRDACLFLYGDYSGTYNDNFVYLTLDANGGEIENDIVFYAAGEFYGALPTATRSGVSLSGWQTSSGTLLSTGDRAAKNLAVTAVWGSGSTAPSTVGFSDVPAGEWFYDYVSDLSANGVVEGYGDGTFRPGRSVTLGAALKLILLSAGYDEQASSGGHWADGYLALARSKGILGEGDGDKLDAEVSRVLIAQIAARALGLSEADVDSPFADTDDGYVLALYRKGILTGSYSNGTLVYKPNDSLTRAEMSAIVWRIMNTNVHANMLQYGSYWAEILEDVPAYSYNNADFHTRDGRMCYDGAQTCTGIDVSKYQGDIDWEAVAADGIDYAIIRLGFRGYGEEGSVNLDEYFTANIEGATAAGLDVGVYFFSQAITVEEAVEEADFVLKYLEGYELSYPVVFDWETIGIESARTYGLDTETLCAAANAFCSIIENAGYTPMVYMTSYVGYIEYDLSEIRDYDFWFAQHGSVPSFCYDFQMWQYSSKGSVNGVDGNVDMNISFKDYSAV